MIFHPDVSDSYVVINSVKITVPRGIKYVTINLYEVLEGWFERPYISEGYWRSDSDDSIRIGSVDIETHDFDRLFEIFEVQR